MLTCYLAFWNWVYGLGAGVRTHTQTNSLIPIRPSPPLPPTLALVSPAAVISGRSWLRGDLASINRHAERLPCLEPKQNEGPSAAGGLVELVKPLWGLYSLTRKKANAGFSRFCYCLVVLAMFLLFWGNPLFLILHSYYRVVVVLYSGSL